MGTIKQRLGRWYYSSALWKSALGALGKVFFELGFWILVATITLALIAISPVNYDVRPTPGNTLFVGKISAAGLALWAVENCYATEEPPD